MGPRAHECLLQRRDRPRQAATGRDRPRSATGRQGGREAGRQGVPRGGRASSYSHVTSDTLQTVKRLRGERCTLREEAVGLHC